MGKKVVLCDACLGSRELMARCGKCGTRGTLVGNLADVPTPDECPCCRGPVGGQCDGRNACRWDDL